MDDRNAGTDDCHVIFYDTPLYDDHAIIYNILNYCIKEIWRKLLALEETYTWGRGQWKRSAKMLANN